MGFQKTNDSITDFEKLQELVRASISGNKKQGFLQPHFYLFWRWDLYRIKKLGATAFKESRGLGYLEKLLVSF